jgi:Flp pilus assembly pilin Flp
MARLLRDFRANQLGVTVIEYALVGCLISVVCISLVTGMGLTIRNLFSTINSAMTTA